MRAFITGLTGFVGPHLATILAAKNCEVVGLGFRSENPDPLRSLPEGVSVFNADIRDYAGLRQILEDVRPDHVYHLAAISNVTTSFKDPRLTYDVNVGGTLNLFEALREIDIRPRIVHVSTAHVYSSIETEAGLDEESPVRLLTPYATSKFMCEALAKQYVEAYRFQTMNVRPFNHVGPGQPTGFVCSDFARQIAAIKLGKAEPVLHVGNLAPVRDFTDVRDTVEAYWTIANQGVPGETYNVSSGNPLSMKQIVTMLCELGGIQVRIEVDQEKFRPIETLRLFGNSSKVRALGWKPHIEFKQTSKDILDWWLAALAGSGESNKIKKADRADHRF
jgi:GDP-4-dehydro-6-deoxy-D-mannose reductase